MIYNVYTDGSYKEINGKGIYASAALIYEEGAPAPIELTNANCDQEYAALHNVTGEVLAVFMAMEYLMNHKKITQEDTVVIHHDYVGISNWCEPVGSPNYFKARNKLTQSYRTYMLAKVKTRCKLQFHRTPGHSGIEGNERADALAKAALERYIMGDK